MTHNNSKIEKLTRFEYVGQVEFGTPVEDLPKATLAGVNASLDRTGIFQTEPAIVVLRCLALAPADLEDFSLASPKPSLRPPPHSRWKYRKLVHAYS